MTLALFLKAVTIALVLLGGILIMDIRLPHIHPKKTAAEWSRRIEAVGFRKDTTAKSAKEYVMRIDGRWHENIVQRSFREAQTTYRIIGQSERYQRILELSFLCGLLGFVLGLILRNPLLAVVLAVGLYFIPLWLSRFTLYRYERMINEELETALSLITTAYLRNNDILGAVAENVKNIKDPVAGAFIGFCNRLKYVDANAPAQIEVMKAQIDSSIFREWCDALILCQENHLLQAALPPIVSKFSDLRAAQESNETRMMEPMRYALIMSVFVGGFCPLLGLINKTWYHNLLYTPLGQIILAGAAVAVFVTINKGISLCQPIRYEE